jgi:putative membrane protein|tara:strand:+ start:417 stop:725 length:309 start_codon:yes stop_codon:yes gene_type:complete
VLTTLKFTGILEEESNVFADILQPLVTSLVFTVAGLILFGAAIWLMAKLAPFSVRKEIEVDQNVALAVIMGCVILGIAIILAASLIDTGGAVLTAPVSQASP